MNDNTIKLNININDKVVEKVVTSPYSIRDLAVEYKDELGKDILLIKCNGKIKELSEDIENDANVQFITMDDNIAKACYRITASFIMLKAIKDVKYKNERKRSSIKFFIRDEYFFELPDNEIPTDEDVINIKKRFKEIVDADIRIVREKKSIDRALMLFKEENMEDEIRLFNYRLYPYVNLHYIEDYFEYSDEHMFDSTGVIKQFDIKRFRNGLLLSFDNDKFESHDNDEMFSEKLFDLQYEGHNWSEKLGVNYVGFFNDAVSRNEFDDLVILQESYHQKNIGDIAEDILKSKKRVVLIAGPSSSGKTTFSHRLSYHLKSIGLNPHPLECDRFFIDRKDTPKDEKGNYNYESLKSIKLERLNNCLDELIKGEEVNISFYNFNLGISEERGETMKLAEDDILILEGIHCLNDELTYKIGKEDKYKIYISAIPKIAIDKVNRISSSDLRLIRRIVRDNRTRGHSAMATIKMWDNVRKGEETNIFPYQNDCDAIFNSSLVYEFSVLKQYIEPLLFNIPNNTKEVSVARRLLKFLSFFLPCNSETIPKYSIIREFIGGSIIDVV